MNEPTRQFGASPSATGELAYGARVGSWRVLRVIGRGGMGEVYLAERADASFDKQVALKLVQGMMTPAAHARFDAEKQALARLEHPHIARLIDAGETEHGWPYLVMEYVDGMQIDVYLADRGVAEVLKVFLQVCDAAAYAHRQLVLHRDIKPSNILVDAQGNAKLLDFGIAKLLQSAERAEDSHTVERAYTPEYASPEQVFGRPIGVASDIYSLGVLLYRLLTGVPPYTFDPGDTVALVRSLQEDTIVAPSRAILGETMQLGSPRRRRSRLLVGDIDTIVRTALKKQPERRYASVDAFAEDIRRHLAHEPIRAQPDSLRYRAGKFLRRNMLAVAATVAVSLALIGGLVASLWQARIAERERVRAEQRFEDVRALAHAMIYDLNDELVKLPGSTSARKKLVQEALTYLQKLNAESDASLPLRRELASAWLRVGDVQGAPGTPNIGDMRGALNSYTQAEIQVEAVLREVRGDREARKLQAIILLDRGEAQYTTSDLPGAESTLRHDITLWEALRRDNVQQTTAGLAQAQASLADALFWDGKHAEADRLYVAALATAQTIVPGKDVHKRDLVIASIEIDRAGLAGFLGNEANARAMLRDALGRLKAMRDAQPDNSSLINAYANASLRLGENMDDLPDKAPMLAAFSEGRDALAKLSAADPSDMRALRELALAEQEVGDSFHALKRNDEAMAHYQTSLQEQQSVATREPGNETVQQDTANSWYDIGMLEAGRHHNTAALDGFGKALALRESLLSRDPSAAALRRDVAMVEVDIAETLTDKAQACKSFLASDEQWQRLASDHSVSPTDQDTIDEVHQHAKACH